MMEVQQQSRRVMKVSDLPFEQLPNLPKPIVNHIDLGITRKTSHLAIEASIADKRRVGFFSAEKSSQTEESDIIPIKSVADTIRIVTADIAEVCKELNYVQYVLREDYEKQLNERAIALHSIANERLLDLEKLHCEKIETIRKSYRTQLSNAINKIAGEYKAYYDDLLQGKTGRHDMRIRELKQTVEVLELKLEESNLLVETLRKEAAEEREAVENKEDTPTLPSGISLERAQELRDTITKLEKELEKAETELAEKDDCIGKLSKKCEHFERLFDEERKKVLRLKTDMEQFKKKVQADKEKAARLAQNQRDALEKELISKMEKEQKEAAEKAAEEAELQRMKDQARFQRELNQQKELEAQLRASAERSVVTPVGVSDEVLTQEVEKLRKQNTKQLQRIEKLEKELVRTNRVWETKLAIMQKNFHALRDESFVRQNLQRQSTLLHYATVGYAATNTPSQPATYKAFHPLPKLHSRRSSGLEDTSTGYDGDTSKHTTQTITISSDPTTTTTSSIQPNTSSSTDPVPTGPSIRSSEDTITERPRSVQFDSKISVHVKDKQY